MKIAKFSYISFLKLTYCKMTWIRPLSVLKFKFSDKKLFARYSLKINPFIELGLHLNYDPENLSPSINITFNFYDLRRHYHYSYHTHTQWSFKQRETILSAILLPSQAPIVNIKFLIYKCWVDAARSGFWKSKQIRKE